MKSSLVERWQLVQAINADSELSASAKIVTVALMGFVNSKTGECFPTFEKIAACCHVSKRTVATATQELERRGWVAIERDEGGDRESNRYRFAFSRIRDGGSAALAVSEAPAVEEIHGENFAPCSDVHGAKSALSMVQNPPVHGAKFAPKLEEENSIKRTQESLFTVDQLPKAAPFDFETWFEQQWWPQYPAGRRVERAEAKKRAKAIIEGRRSDGLKATPDELLGGLLRYAASDDVRRGFPMKPINWLNHGRWADEHAALGVRRTSAIEEEVYPACAAMAARSMRAV